MDSSAHASDAPSNVQVTSASWWKGAAKSIAGWFSEENVTGKAAASTPKTADHPRCGLLACSSMPLMSSPPWSPSSPVICDWSCVCSVCVSTMNPNSSISSRTMGASENAV